MTKNVALITHPDMLKHNTGQGHPEQPERIKSVLQTLKDRDYLPELLEETPEPAAREWIETVHDSKYVDRVELMCRKAYPTIDSPDTSISKDSFRAALLAAGSGLKAADLIRQGLVRRVFCLVRPPGHHAERNRAMGFCLFNNIAVVARYLQQKHGVQKILIVDWDVHHGNGTQQAFYEDNSVFYFSTHQSPHYPGSGGKEEIGRGPGKGFTRNVPLPAGSGDKAYLQAFEEILVPIAESFQPEFVLISAGFDPHRDDPLSGMKVTEKGFAGLTAIVRKIADRTADGRLISLLEGGYNLKALGNSAAAHVQELLQQRAARGTGGRNDKKRLNLISIKK